ncbi:MAG: serine hydrolase domain-containing protein [Myxococcota bacterium]
MNPPRIRALAPALVALASIATGCQLDLQPLSSSLDAEAERALDRGFDGIVLHVNQPGRTSFHSAGWNDREHQVPADTHSLFKIASISKLYIAATTTKLAADARLSLDSTLAEHIPEVAGRIENADRITVRMLVSHRSGIPEYIFHPDFPVDPYETYLQTASLVYDQPANFGPDARYQYSNTNYLLLGEVLDRTLGTSHHDFIRDEILQPLGLTDTFSLMDEVDPDDVMSGYLIGYEPDLKLMDDHTRPGGSMVATAADVGVFVRALVDGTLLMPDEQAIYTSLYPYEHTGWLNGYTSIVRYHSDVDAVVVQFVNTSSDGLFWLDLERVYSRAVRIVERETESP